MSYTSVFIPSSGTTNLNGSPELTRFGSTWVIPGFGPSTVHLLASTCLQPRHRLPDRIFIIDPDPMLRGGTAHSHPSSSFRVNMRIDLHDIPGQAPFADFLQEQGVSLLAPPARYWLGEYVKRVAAQCIDNLRRKGVHVEHILGEAVEMEARGASYVVHLRDRAIIEGTAVVLATGNERPNTDLVVTSKPIVAYAGGADFARGIHADQKALVLGTSLGGIDVARYLIHDLGVVHPVALRSRSGMLPTVQTALPANEAMKAEAHAVVIRLKAMAPFGLSTLAEHINHFFTMVDPTFDWQAITERLPAFDQLRVDLAAAAAGGPKWRTALEAVATEMPALWRALQPSERKRFLANPRWVRLYYTHRHAMPMATAQWLLQQYDDGRITVDTTDAAFPDHDYVVVATGPEYRISRTANPLLKNLLASGFVTPCEIEGYELGGLKTEGFGIIGHPNVYAMGALVRGEDFAVHSFPALRRHAAEIVDRLTHVEPLSAATTNAQEYETSPA